MAEALDKLAPVASGNQTVPADGGKQEALRKAEAPRIPFIPQRMRTTTAMIPIPTVCPSPSRC